MSKHFKTVQYIEFDDAGKIFLNAKADMMFATGHDHKSDRIIEILLPNDGERPYYRAVHINPDVMRKLLNDCWADYIAPTATLKSNKRSKRSRK